MGGIVVRHVRIDPAEGPTEERPADGCRFAGIPDAQGGPGRRQPAEPRAEVEAAVMGAPPVAPGPHREAA